MHTFRRHEPLSYTIEDTMAATGLGRTKIYDCIAKGLLKRVKVGSRTLITADSVRALVSGEA